MQGGALNTDGSGTSPLCDVCSSLEYFGLVSTITTWSVEAFDVLLRVDYSQGTL